MIRLAIIGTAGRTQELRSKLGPHHMQWMAETIESYVDNVLGIDCSQVILVSGGSAWADHVAVQLFNSSDFGGLHLHLPAHFGTKSFDSSYSGRRLDQLHKLFTAKIGIDTLAELAHSISDDRAQVMTYSNFYARNRAIAQNCDHLIAFTFDPLDPLGGGTGQTWSICKTTKTHFTLD